MAAAAAPSKRYSVDDLAQFPDDGKRRELVDGRIVEWEVTTLRHSFFLVILAGMVRAFVLQHRLGLVAGGDPFVRVQGSQFDARGPDVAFYARGRKLGNLDAATTEYTPDFVIEILSPSDKASEVQAKVRDWLRAGVRLLWYVDPGARVTTVYRGNQIVFVAAEEVLDGGDVLPGFQLRLRDVFDELAIMDVDEA